MSDEQNSNGSPEETKVQASDSRIEEKHIYKNRTFYAFRYVIMLLTGGSFIASLISILSITISKWVDKDFSVPYWAGSFYANMVTAVVILGIIHLLISLTVGANWKPEDGEKRRYPAVLSVIYSVGLGVSAITYLVLFLGIMLGSIMDLNDAKGKDVLEQFLVSLVAIAILGFALAYKLNLFKKMQKAIYVIAMGSIAFIGVVLFMVFPAKEVREAVHDRNTTSDLSVIEVAIEKYYNKEGSLPGDLKELTAVSEKNNKKPYLDKSNLNYKLTGYKYSISDGGSNSRYYSYAPQYQICANFKTNTIDGDDDDDYYYDYKSYGYGGYGFGYHESGEYCFDRTVSGRSGVYDDYDYYNNIGSSSNYYYEDDDEDEDWYYYDDEDDDSIDFDWYDDLDDDDEGEDE